MAATLNLVDEDAVQLLEVKSSPFVVRVMIGLRLMNIPYQFIQENPLSKSEQLLKSNPIYRKVPVLLHHGRAVCESFIVLEYIDETWPSSACALPPCDPYDRALARFWAFFIDGKLSESVKPICMSRDEEAKKKAITESIENFALLEEVLRTTFRRKAFFRGDGVGFLDIVLGSLFAHFKAAEAMGPCTLICKEKTPLLSAWMQRFCETEAAHGLLPDPTAITLFFTNTFHWNAGN